MQITRNKIFGGVIAGTAALAGIGLTTSRGLSAGSPPTPSSPAPAAPVTTPAAAPAAAFSKVFCHRQDGFWRYDGAPKDGGVHDKFVQECKTVMAKRHKVALRPSRRTRELNRLIGTETRRVVKGDKPYYEIIKAPPEATAPPPKACFGVNILVAWYENGDCPKGSVLAYSGWGSYGWGYSIYGYGPYYHSNNVYYAPPVANPPAPVNPPVPREPRVPREPSLPPKVDAQGNVVGRSGDSPSHGAQNAGGSHNYSDRMAAASVPTGEQGYDYKVAYTTSNGISYNAEGQNVRTLPGSPYATRSPADPSLSGNDGKATSLNAPGSNPYQAPGSVGAKPAKRVVTLPNGQQAYENEALRVLNDNFVGGGKYAQGSDGIMHPVTPGNTNNSFAGRGNQGGAAGAQQRGGGHPGATAPSHPGTTTASAIRPATGGVSGFTPHPNFGGGGGHGGGRR